MVVYGYVWLVGQYEAFNRYVRLCMVMYCYVWLCRAVYGYVWLCRAI